ncbi:Zinc resistance conferring protein [Basidiobolus ranarum]|uniref:Zinc resistance conferring protein n=1 Tax=Basidiobolus ranarum TaxID=34480 RepID=A0ABR2WWW9_9FUNG
MMLGEEIENPVLVLIVGGLGLIVNTVGLFLFHEHSHAGHSHGVPSPRDIENSVSCGDSALSHQSGLQTTEGLPISHHTIDGATEEIAVSKEERQSDSSKLNMHGVFLHVLGDALGSIAVIISSLIIWLTTFPQRFLFDPIISLLITGFILYFTIPLVRSSAYILLQGVPRSIPVDELRNRILKISNVISLHELHIWQLSDNKTIASVHIHVTNVSEYMVVATEVRRLLHSYGIHSATIQPEFSSERTENIPRDDTSETLCLLGCSSECDEKKCCEIDNPSLENMTKDS